MSRHRQLADKLVGRANVSQPRFGSPLAIDSGFWASHVLPYSRPRRDEKSLCWNFRSAQQRSGNGVRPPRTRCEKSGGKLVLSGSTDDISFHCCHSDADTLLKGPAESSGTMRSAAAVAGEGTTVMGFSMLWSICKESQT